RDQEPPLLLEELLERAALHVLHGEEVEAAALADVVDLDDVGMVQLPRGARLGEEHVDAPAVAREAAGEDLQRHLPVERDLEGLVARAHAAAAEPLADLVAADLLPRELALPAAGGRGLVGDEREEGRAHLELVLDLDRRVLLRREALPVEEGSVRAPEVADD